MPVDSRFQRVRFLLCLVLLWLASSAPGRANEGAPDVYTRTVAGPYTLLVGVHMPSALPGATRLDIRTVDSGVEDIRVGLPGEPTQQLKRLSSEHVYTGTMWVSSGHSWHLMIHVSGSHGEADAMVPVPATSDIPKRFAALKSLRLGWILAALVVLGLALVFRSSGRIIRAVAVTVVLAVFMEAGYFAFKKPSPPGHPMQVSLGPDGNLNLTIPGQTRDVVLDHGYRMNLFAVRQPQLDVLLSLHPAEATPNHFTAALPTIDAGAFRFYADIVHSDSRQLTFTAAANLPSESGPPLKDDDSVSLLPGIDRTQTFSGPGSTTVPLADGFRMTLDLATALHPAAGELLGVTLLDPSGKPPTDMQLYMGMPAHALIVKTDGSVFAQIHPSGTIPMVAYGSALPAVDTASAASNQASFPFGFPLPGTYRLFVQMKHGTTIETAAFDLLVQ